MTDEQQFIVSLVGMFLRLSPTMLRAVHDLVHDIERQHQAKAQAKQKPTGEP